MEIATTHVTYIAIVLAVVTIVSESALTVLSTVESPAEDVFFIVSSLMYLALLATSLYIVARERKLVVRPVWGWV